MVVSEECPEKRWCRTTPTRERTRCDLEPVNVPFPSKAPGSLGPGAENRKRGIHHSGQLTTAAGLQGRARSSRATIAGAETCPGFALDTGRDWRYRPHTRPRIHPSFSLENSWSSIPRIKTGIEEG